MKRIHENSHRYIIHKIAYHLGVTTIPALAQKLNISRQAIQQWSVKGVPPSRALELEKLTHGKLKASDLIKLL